jgi:hypothetical protein
MVYETGNGLKCCLHVSVETHACRSNMGATEYDVWKSAKVQPFTTGADILAIYYTNGFMG